ncbi:MAG TPA: hypothetical protein VGE02_15835 [Gemmatimonadales bacterium]
MKVEIRRAPPPDTARRRRQAIEWVPIFAGPLALAVNLQVSYMLVPAACSGGTRVLIAMVHLAMLLMVVASGDLAWRLWNDAGRGWPGDETGHVERRRFLAVLGLLVSALFTIVVVWQAVPTVVLSPCQ